LGGDSAGTSASDALTQWQTRKEGDEKRGRKQARCSASIGSDGCAGRCVIAFRTKDLGDGRTVREYNVRWKKKGYADEFNSWESISSLDAFDSIKLYLQQQVLRQVPHVTPCSRYVFAWTIYDLH
jgi:hypothetical protein